ncbi:MAG TPA: VCBS repeat-containing protein, partial [Polyangiaceae bacterium]
MRSYELSYSTSTLNPLSLVALRKCALGVCTPPTRFVYSSLQGFGPARAANEVQPPEWFGNGIGSGDKGRTLVLDANGDGKDDLLYPGGDVNNLTYQLALAKGTPGSATGSQFLPPIDTQLSALPEPLATGNQTNCLSGANVVDINGDGLDDIIDECSHLRYPLNCHDGDCDTGYRVQVSTGQGFDVEWLPLGLKNDIEDRVYTADLTGDGRFDLIRCVTDAGSIGGHPPFHYEVYPNKGPGLGFETPVAIESFGPGCRYGPQFMDVDGDGVANMVQRHHDPFRDYNDTGSADWNTEWKAFFIRPSGSNWESINLFLPEVPVDDSGHPQGLIANEDYFVSENGGQMTATAYAGSWQFKGIDFNGDGLGDIAYYRGDKPTSERLALLINTGKGFVTRSAPLPADAPYISRFAFYRAITTDYDGDGQQDLLVPTGISHEGSNIAWYVLRAVGVANDSHFEVMPVNLGLTIFDQSVPIQADIDGDGNSDLIALNANSPNGLSVAHGFGGSSHLMISATDGVGKGVNLNYAAVSQESTGSNVYNRSGCSAVTRRTVTCVRKVGTLVSDYDEFIDIGAIGSPPDPGNRSIQRSYNFEYLGGRVGLYGRGWLGFEQKKRVTYDRTGGRVQVDVWGYDNSTYFETIAGSSVARLYPFAGLPTSHIQTMPRLDRQLIRLSTDWQLKLSDAGLPFAHLGSSTKRNTASNVVPGPTSPEFTLARSSETNETDVWGNPTRTEVTTYGANNQEVEKRVTVRTFEPTAAERENWLISLIKRVEVTSATPEKSVKRSARFDYEASGQIKSATTEPDDNYYKRTLTIVSRHPRTGHVQEVSETDAEGHVRTTRTAYDSRGLFPESHFDAKGFESRVRHDAATGQLLITADPNSVMGRFGYDGFGRRVVEEGPSSTRTTTYVPINTLGPARLRVISETTGGERAEGVFDGQDHLIQRVTKGLKGTDVFESMTYDSFGRLTRQERPHVSGDATQGELDWAYDDLDRLTLERRGNGAEYTYDYLTLFALPDTNLNPR